MARYWGEKKKKREPRNIMTAGEVYGRLTVIEPAGATKSRIKLWKCTCSCGGSKVVRHDHLRNGHTISCGCARSGRFINQNQSAVGYRVQMKKDFVQMIKDGMSAHKWAEVTGLSTRTFYNYRLSISSRGIENDSNI